MLQGHKLRRLWLGWRVDCESHSIDVLRVHGGIEFCRPGYWSGGPFPSPGDLPNPGIEPRSPTLQADSLPAEPQGKPKNTGVGSLSLLQWVFPTQESNRGHLHCRRILYQLSYEGSIYVYISYMYTYISSLLDLPTRLPSCSPISAIYVILAPV